MIVYYTYEIDVYTYTAYIHARTCSSPSFSIFSCTSHILLYISCQTHLSVCFFFSCFPLFSSDFLTMHSTCKAKAASFTALVYPDVIPSKSTSPSLLQSFTFQFDFMLWYLPFESFLEIFRARNFAHATGLYSQRCVQIVYSVILKCYTLM